MKRLLQLSIFAVALALSGCQDETEETPDITEAIPLDDDATLPTEEEATMPNGGEASAASASGGWGTRGAISGAQTSDGQAIPDTMQTGSNPPGMTEPPKGSKVQRIK
ncbi:MAG: hypothetical protein AAFY42_05470 [Pseudomonadota bacterium]